MKTFGNIVVAANAGLVAGLRMDSSPKEITQRQKQIVQRIKNRTEAMTEMYTLFCEEMDGLAGRYSTWGKDKGEKMEEYFKTFFQNQSTLPAPYIKKGGFIGEKEAQTLFQNGEYHKLSSEWKATCIRKQQTGDQTVLFNNQKKADLKALLKKYEKLAKGGDQNLSALRTWVTSHGSVSLKTEVGTHWVNKYFKN